MIGFSPLIFIFADKKKGKAKGDDKQSGDTTYVTYTPFELYLEGAPDLDIGAALAGASETQKGMCTYTFTYVMYA